MPNLLDCVGRAVADVGIAELVAVVADPNVVNAAGVVAKIAANAWKEWRANKKQDKLNADILAAAKLSFEDAKKQAAEIARQVSSDPEVQGHVERFVTLIPASIRASLRRPEDPSGTTLPAQYVLQDADDLVPLLPARLPRFKPGDAPTFLKGWRLIEQIGAGGFGEVWKAQHTRASNLLRAVKFGHGLDAAEQSLLNEGDVLNRLLADGQPDGVVKLLDMWADGDPLPWLQYEYVPGGDLTGLIHRWQRLPAADRVTRAADALGQLAATVGHFHTLRPFVVHRDLKPSNILIGADGRLKVADFGIGAVSSKRLLATGGGKLSAGGLLASYLRGSHTPLYASPQQRAGGRTLDPRDDVHALGVIAFQMFTGQLDAAPGSDAEHDLTACGTPPLVIDLIKSCTARDPARRPENARELNERLQIALRAKPLAPEVIQLIDGLIDQPKATHARPIASRVTPPVAPPVRRGQLVPEAKPQPTATAPQPNRRGCLGAMLLLGGGAVVAGYWWWPNLRHALPWGDPLALPPPMISVRPAGEKYTLAFGNQFEMSFVWCPPGVFTMGREAGEASERPARTVTLYRGFYLSTTEVTQAQWLAVMGTDPSHKKAKGDTLPVNQVSWSDAVSFCGKLSERTNKKVKCRLPTEAEWEYACRAGTTTAYSYGDGADMLKMNTSSNGLAAVGQKAANPWGLFDMHGNAEEWCEDIYDAKFYTSGPAADPVCTSERWTVDPNSPPPLGGGSTNRVVRGGSWGSSLARCTSSARDGMAPGTAAGNIGFRVAFTPGG